MIVVTSFSPDGWTLYGRQFVEAYNWPCPLWVGVENDLALYPQRDGVSWFRIDTALRDKLAEIAPPWAKNDYRFQAWKFCQKVLAYADGGLPDADWLIWLDADVTFKDAPPADLCDRFSGYDYAYLGRQDWHHSECGFIAFRMSQGVRAMIRRIRWYYATGRVMALPEWHDSYVFDVVRKEFDLLKGFNISARCEGTHVWPQTFLEAHVTHHKGELKQQAFGASGDFPGA